MPLSDIRVVECGQVIAGPLAGTFLGDLGADVVKVEPHRGELFRTDRRRLDGEPFNPGFELYNRNKRSLSLDLKRDAGRESLHDLVEVADVFVQNWPPGVAERLGADYETLRELNDDLVYVHVTGFGETGPLANNPGMDTIVQHMSGFTSLMGDGLEEGPPIRSQSSLADVFAAYSAALSAVAALRRVDRGEGGQKVDVSLLESLVHNVDAAFEYYNNLGEVPGPGGRNTFSQPDMLYGAAEAADGYVVVALLLYSDRVWEAYCDLLGREDLRNDDRYRTEDGRLADASKLSTIFEGWLAEQPADEAVDAMNAAGIPAAHVNDIAEAAEMDHLAERGTFVDVDHPRYGELTLTDTPLDLSETPPTIRRHAPLLGEHSREVLDEIGYDPETLDGLVEAGVVEQR